MEITLEYYLTFSAKMKTLKDSLASLDLALGTAEWDRFFNYSYITEQFPAN